MKDDYLWDRSGEPEAEVQELEEILGALRYQPQPLELPRDTPASRPFFSLVASRLAPSLAIAATLALVLFALGLWLGIQRRQQPEQPVLVEKAATPRPEQPILAAGRGTDQTDQAVNIRAAGTKHPEPRRRSNSVLLARRQQEGKAAKDQLLLALRLASAKLNFAQRKTLNLNPRDPMLNQHKIG
jgi:hypothetical protein